MESESLAWDSSGEGFHLLENVYFHEVINYRCGQDESRRFQILRLIIIFLFFFFIYFKRCFGTESESFARIHAICSFVSLRKKISFCCAIKGSFSFFA